MTCPMAIMSVNWVSINVWKVAGALHNPNIITNDSKSPSGVLNAVFSTSLGWIQILLYPHQMSNLVKKQAPSNLSTRSRMRGIGAAFFLVILFKG
jgi:hypothetical protein